jgi:hypothetical protein
LFVNKKLNKVYNMNNIDNERFIYLVSYLKENRYIRNQQDFTERVKSDKSTVSQIMNNKITIPNKMFANILNAFPFISLEWLITGEGEMLKNSTISTRDNLNISGGNKGNIRQGDVNNNISISLPEKGTQKIIDPDGTVTIENTSSSVQNNLNEIDMLNQRIQYLERIVSGHEATIKSLETTIKSKDDLICILRSSLDKQD